MSPLGFTVWLLLQAFFFMMFGSLVVELIRFSKPGWRPAGLVGALVKVFTVVTEVPLKFMRKVIPNVRLGATSIDLSWTVLALLVSIASTYAQRL